MTSPAANVITRLRSVLGPGADGPTDTALLARFATAGDEGAFELLVWRHSGMVLRVCRSILHDHHAAEDASQAAFLALPRQAATVCRRGTVAGWLYRVAWRIAANAARRQRPQVSPDLSEFPPRELDPVLAPTLAAALHEELGRLPEKYRVPLLLCFYEGFPHAQAAKQLGWPIGTLAVWVARAKNRLVRRLTQCGVAAPAAGFVESTVQVTVAFAVGGETIVGVSKTVVLQASGVIRT